MQFIVIWYHSLFKWYLSDKITIYFVYIAHIKCANTYIEHRVNDWYDMADVSHVHTNAEYRVQNNHMEFSVSQLI